jgi:hypothetical protein
MSRGPGRPGLARRGARGRRPRARDRRRPAASSEAAVQEPPSSGSGTASIDPRGRSWTSRSRAATSTSASSSENTPARQAATSSPTLWPSAASHRMPQCFHSWASEYSKAKRAGWVTAVSARRSAALSSCPAGGNRTSRRSNPSSARSRSAHRSSSERKTASVSYSSRPIPGRCVPWPGNRKATDLVEPSLTPSIADRVLSPARAERASSVDRARMARRGPRPR